MQHQRYKINKASALTNAFLLIERRRRLEDERQTQDDFRCERRVDGADAAPAHHLVYAVQDVDPLYKHTVCFNTVKRNSVQCEVSFRE